MLAHARDSFLDDEFGRPVESIMRCEDFKSNFARRLSNRYISRSSVSGSRQDTVLKLRPADKQETLNNVPERVEQCSQLSKSSNLEQNGEIVKPPDKMMRHSADLRGTEVSALNMEVDTLRWQLAQTEANRQMHIALLKQIVTFLNRVKEHIECQKNEADIRLDALSPAPFPSAGGLGELPRSRSVLHVSKNLDYSISPAKKMGTRKISKSISNVNGYKHCSSVWGNSKLSLVSENETGKKLTEEMSRLITLANTVLGTTLPELACACVRAEPAPPGQPGEADGAARSGNDSLSLFKDKSPGNPVLNTDCKSDVYNGITNKFADMESSILNEFIVSQSPLSFASESNSSGAKLFDRERPGFVTSCGKVAQTVDKRNEYNGSSNFIEDESGFSSMSSFQEIGIPIISIIPPSPCKEADPPEQPAGARPGGAAQLDQQSVRVFWV